MNRASLRRLGIGLLLGAIGFNPAPALTDTCEARVAHLDTFGEVRWAERLTQLPRWAKDVDCSDKSDCRFRDRAGVSYQLIDGHMMDKQLDIGPKTKLPWGLGRNDTPQAIRRTLEAQVGGTARQSSDRITIDLPGCEGLWLDVALGADRRIRAVSFNEQP